MELLQIGRTYFDTDCKEYKVLASYECNKGPSAVMKDMETGRLCYMHGTDIDEEGYLTWNERDNINATI